MKIQSPGEGGRNLPTELLRLTLMQTDFPMESSKDGKVERWPSENGSMPQGTRVPARQS